MSKMAELFTQIEELLEKDYTGSEIADMLNIDIDMVYDVMDALEEENAGNDCDDSDDGYALASAGFGTDEDYGYYGD